MFSCCLNVFFFLPCSIARSIEGEGEGRWPSYPVEKIVICTCFELKVTPQGLPERTSDR